MKISDEECLRIWREIYALNRSLSQDPITCDMIRAILAPITAPPTPDVRLRGALEALLRTTKEVHSNLYDGTADHQQAPYLCTSERMRLWEAITQAHAALAGGERVVVDEEVIAAANRVLNEIQQHIPDAQFHDDILLIARAITKATPCG